MPKSIELNMAPDESVRSDHSRHNQQENDTQTWVSLPGFTFAGVKFWGLGFGFGRVKKGTWQLVANLAGFCVPDVYHLVC